MYKSYSCYFKVDIYYAFLKIFFLNFIKLYKKKAILSSIKHKIFKIKFHYYSNNNYCSFYSKQNEEKISCYLFVKDEIENW